MADVTQIREYARKLNLMNIANGVIDITDESVSNLDYLCNLFEQEIALRSKNKKADLLLRAKLPKTEFDHSGISPGLAWQLEQIMQIDFRNEQQNIMIVGECLTGKTALAAEIGRSAVEKQAKVLYISAEDFLIAAKRQNTNWKRMMKCDLIILDELFYITPSDEELTQLYKTVMFLIESRSFIFITNRLLSEWAKMNADSHLTETFRKRIMINTQLIHMG